MKLISNRSLILLLVTSLVIFSCAKENPEPEEPETPTTPVNKGSFTYNVNGNATITADSAVYHPKFTTIYSYKQGMANTIEINLSDIVVGTYSVNPVAGNEIKYVTGGNTYTVNSGIVNITSNTGSRLSGNFSGNFTGGQVTTISGQFSEITYR